MAHDMTLEFVPMKKEFKFRFRFGCGCSLPKSGNLVCGIFLPSLLQVLLILLPFPFPLRHYIAFARRFAIASLCFACFFFCCFCSSSFVSSYHFAPQRYLNLCTIFALNVSPWGRSRRSPSTTHHPAQSSARSGQSTGEGKRGVTHKRTRLYITTHFR